MSFGFKRALLIVAIAATVAGVSLLMYIFKPEPRQRPVGDIALVVEVAELDAGRYEFNIETQGTVRPLTETALSAEVVGLIVSVSPKFVAGGVFKKDEELMRIDRSNYIADRQQAEALLKQRQIEYDGAKTLRTQGYRAEAEYAAAEAALATASANLIRAERNLDRTIIRLPYDGMVRSRAVDLGQFINPGQQLGVVFGTDFAEVRLPLTDNDLAFIELPDAVDVTASGQSAQGPAVRLTATQHGKPAVWHAQIVRSEGVVDERARVTYAVARIADPYNLRGATHGTALPVGTFVQGEIVGKALEQVIRVPRSVVRRNNEILFVDDEDRLRLRAVDIVRTDARFAYLTPGDLVGQRISLTAVGSPLNGTPVKVLDAAAGATSRQAASQ